LLGYAQQLGLAPLHFPKIYLSRRQAKMRQVSNEAELIPLLESAGYAIICAEDFSFWEQVLLFAQCQSLISIHGAGLTNLMFMPAQGQVLELILPPQQVPYNDCYANLCAATGVKYRALAGELASKLAHLPADQQNLSIHTEELQDLLSE
jgi:capsular polysaccharide biosynthesis protein